MNMYKVLNPMTGEYADASNAEECLTMLAQNAWSLYLRQTHDQPYMLVTINEDGSEVWRTPAGNTVLSPAQLDEAVQRELPRTLAVSILGE